VVDDNSEKIIGIITDKDILKAVARKTSITTSYIPKQFDVEE
jgi:CBS domain-containing protein